MLRTRSALLCLTVVFVAGTLACSSASAVEAPFWEVAGKRLESEVKKTATMKTPAGTEIVLHGALGSAKIEIRCKKGAFGEGGIEGSLTKHDGKAFGFFELSECKLFAEKGGKFEEQAGCAVEAIKSEKKLAGRMWLEGSEAAQGRIIVVAFEASEEKAPLAKVTIKTVEGKTCEFAGTDNLEGKFAANLKPENKEALAVNWVLPATPISTVWQPPNQAGEMKIELLFAGKAASLQGELATELTAKEEFGGFGPPQYYFQNEDVEAEKAEGVVGTAQLQGEIFSTKILIQCTANALGEMEVKTGGESSGKVEYKSCSLFSIKEGVKTNLGPNCKVTEPINFGFKNRLFVQEKARVVADEFKPNEGKTFVELKVGGAFCIFTAGSTLTLKVEGTYAASLGDQAEEDMTEHEIVFNETGSSITFEGKPASFTNTLSKFKLKSGKGWRVE